jgi:hypothetical protein
MVGLLAILIWWYDWGVLAGLILAVALAAWIFLDSQRRMIEALMWRILSIAGLVVILPSLYEKFQTVDRIFAGRFTAADLTGAPQILQRLLLFGALGLVGGIVTIVAGFGYLILRQREPDEYPYPPLGETVREPVAPPPTVPRDRGAGVTISIDEPERAMAWLAVKSGPRKGKQFGLTTGRNKIGRDGKTCDIILDDATISRDHASIGYERGRFVIHDLHSKSGTFVNEREVQKQTLMDDDEIRLGKTKLVFKEVKP